MRQLLETNLIAPTDDLPGLTYVWMQNNYFKTNAAIPVIASHRLPLKETSLLIEN